MQLTIKPVISKELEGIVQYYIFCTSSRFETFSYQTFPNTNLCLSLYKENKVTYSKEINFCKVENDESLFSSKLWGLHESIFNVNIHANVNQICILFHPSGIRKFTDISYETLLTTPNVFELVFGNKSTTLLEKIFETNDFSQRVNLIEQFLHKKIVDKHFNKSLDRAIQQILKQNGDIKIEYLSNQLGVHDTTLYKYFIKHVGQSPKDFIKLVRFRSALFFLKQQKSGTLTDISYSYGYYDQSHFIKEFLHFTQHTPKEIKNNAVLEQEKLIWIRNPS